MKAPTHDQLLNAAAMLAGEQPEVAQLLTDLARIGGLSDADLQAAYQLMDEQAEQAMKGHAK